MLSKKIQIIKGAAFHIMEWVKSPSNDIVMPNPHFAHRSNNKGVVIYCVHGAVDRSASFKYISEHLIPHLPDTVVSIIMVAFKQRLKGKSIAFYANQLMNKILDNKHENIIFLGHSMGGLVAATAAEELKNKSIKVKSVITICSPLKGSSRIIAPFQYLAKSLHEMVPHSDFLIELEKKIKQNEIPAANAINYLFISSSDDVICPPEFCVIPSSLFKSHCVENEGHLSIMSSDQLVKILHVHIAELAQHVAI